MAQKKNGKNADLAAAMARMGISSGELAKRAGLHPVSISRILNLRQTPTEATASRIAMALGTGPAQLFASGVRSTPEAAEVAR